MVVVAVVAGGTGGFHRLLGQVMGAEVMDGHHAEGGIIELLKE